MNDQQKRLSTKIKDLQRNLTLKDQQLQNFKVRHEKDQHDLKDSDERFLKTFKDPRDKATEIGSDLLGTPIEVAVQTNETIAS